MTPTRRPHRARRHETLAGLALLAVAMLAGCGDDDDPTSPANFSLALAVKDAQGDPVPGLDLLVHVPIPSLGIEGALPPKNGPKPACRMKYLLADTCHVTVNIIDLENDLVRRLIDEVRPSGPGLLMWIGDTDDGRQMWGTQIFRCVMTARDADDDTLLGEAEDWLVLCTGHDADRRPDIGTTNTLGEVLVTDRRYFPFLYDLPEIPQRDENGDPVGPVILSDAVLFALADPLSGEHQNVTVTVTPGHDRIDVVRNPAKPGATPDPTPATSETLTPETGTPPPNRAAARDGTYALLCYPTPFN